MGIYLHRVVLVIQRVISEYDDISRLPAIMVVQFNAQLLQIHHALQHPLHNLFLSCQPKTEGRRPQPPFIEFLLLRVALERQGRPMSLQ